MVPAIQILGAYRVELTQELFLHFFDPTKPLETSYGKVAVPPIQPMPRRLRKLVSYESMD